MSDAAVLVVQHVPWEGPHRIADALAARGFALDTRCTLTGDALPPVDAVAGAVFMGGPMNVDQTAEFPGLLAERVWLSEAVASGLPVLGVCLGAQLIAKAIGATIVPGAAPEIGWSPVTIHAGSDLLAAHLAPSTPVLHWHGDVFDLPPSAELLASSDRTEVQAFRAMNAWGLLFHAEADAALVETWLAEPSMLAEARAALGAEAADRIRAGAAQHEAALIAASGPLFADFAELLAAGGPAV